MHQSLGNTYDKLLCLLLTVDFITINIAFKTLIPQNAILPTQVHAFSSWKLPHSGAEEIRAQKPIMFSRKWLDIGNANSQLQFAFPIMTN